ncbi:MAG: PRC-barrel domain-containing protein [Spirochaetota bacterium]
MYMRLARLRRFAARVNRRDAGNVDTLYLDPDDWAIRLILLGFDDSASRPDARLVSPMHLSAVDPGQERLKLALGDVGAYPCANSDRHLNLSPADVGAVVSHYGLPVFWNGSGVWGDYETPCALRAAANGHRTVSRAPELFPHTTLMGRPVFAPNGRLGVISDLLLDLSAWRVRYLVVWLQAPGETGEILLSPFWVNGAPEKPCVTVPMTTEAIVSGPNFAPEELEPLDEQILARYFGFIKE